jgi:hypothetical protein
MAGERDLAEAVKALAGMDDLQYESSLCIVSDVNTTTNTCTCTPVNGNAPYYDVSLSCDLKKGFLLIPTNGSQVICTETSDTTAYISMVSDVTQVYIAGDVNGGLIKVVDLVTKLNNIENLLNGFISLYNTHIHVGVDSVTFAPVTISPTVAQQTTVLTPTVRANIESTVVKHGNG